jgi:hypothetical protein
MKGCPLLLMVSYSYHIANGQANFKWEVTDSSKKSASEIYSETKMFIAKTWKSSNEVIQNDDKEAGIILVKAISLQKESFC